MKKLTIRIKQAPQDLDSMAYGGQANYGLDIVPDFNRTDTLPDVGSIRTTLKAVDRDEANIEAEAGETIVGDFDQDGMNEHMKVGGNRHHKGGTPLAVPDGAFVFSDTRKMRLGGETLKEFGKSEKDKKKYTPADLAKQYDINTYKAILDNPHADPIQKRTAEMMISNYEIKLGKLAMVQESMKGFPTGVPQVAMPYLMATQQVGPPAMEESQPVMRHGGELQKFADGGSGRRYGFMDIDLDPHKSDKLATPNPKTQVKSRDWNKSRYTKEEWEGIKSRVGYAGPDDNKAFQSFLLERFPEIVNKHHSDAPGGFGMPNAKKAVDGLLGVRWDAIADDVIASAPEIAPVKIPGVTYNNELTLPQIAEKELKAGVQPGTASFANRPDATSKYWTQDKINVLAAMKNRNNIKKYLPWQAPVVGVAPDPTFYDPSRELAANSEAMNMQMMAGNQYSGAQAGSVRNSAMAGAAAENAANILAKYNNLNVGVADQFAGISADVTNKTSAANAERMSKMYDGRTVANQNFDNSVAQANDVIRKNLLSGLDNKQKAQWVNTWYPQYNIDPQSGMVGFEEGSGHKSITGASGGNSAGNSYIELYNKLKKDHPGVPDDILKKQADLMMGQMNARNTIESDGDAKSTYRGQMPPDLMNLMKFTR